MSDENKQARVGDAQSIIDHVEQSSRRITPRWQLSAHRMDLVLDTAIEEVAAR